MATHILQSCQKRHVPLPVMYEPPVWKTAKFSVSNSGVESHFRNIQCIMFASTQIKLCCSVSYILEILQEAPTPPLRQARRTSLCHKPSFRPAHPDCGTTLRRDADCNEVSSAQCDLGPGWEQAKPSFPYP